MDTHAPGWLPDPLGRYQYRYWDGSEWTDRVSTQGSSEIDPDGVTPTPASVSAASATEPATPRGTAAAFPNQVRVLVLLGVAAIAVGSILPWVKASAGPFTATKNGTDGDGVITLLLAGLAAVGFLVARQTKAAAWIVVTCAGLAGAVALYDTIDISNKADDLARNTTISVSATVGEGLWIALLGAVVALVGGIMALRTNPRA
jgi:hypothetical protein